jgi:ComF family protein
MAFKFGRQASVAEALAPAMVESLAHAARAGPSVEDIVLTWVPLGKRRKRDRGYDQAEVLARAVGALAGRPVIRLLDRAIETAPQARKRAAERSHALLGAFRAATSPPPRVVLVDDVLTTGSTAEACAASLLEAGAVEVGVLTAARSLGGPIPGRCYDPPRASAWVCGCPGDPLPVVDASRRRNDPRKATIGR